ncbi:MAG: type II toxin-antitoxin system VapC family toxin [Candidatus Limnocylindria bacterium]
MAGVIVLDTTVLVDHLRGLDAARAYLLKLPSVPACSEVTRVELLQGLRHPERRATERLMAAIKWIPVDERISRRAGDLGRRFRRSHADLGIGDLIVAATALELDARLATANVRHFPMFRRLRPPY